MPNKIGYRPRLRIRRPGIILLNFYTLNFMHFFHYIYIFKFNLIDQVPTLSNNVNQEDLYLSKLKPLAEENQSYRQKLLKQSLFSAYNFHSFHGKPFIIEDHEPVNQNNKNVLLSQEVFVPAKNLGTKNSQISPLTQLKEEFLNESESFLIQSSTLPAPTTTLSWLSSSLPKLNFQQIENGENIGSIGEQPPQPSIKILPIPAINKINENKTIKFSPKNKTNGEAKAFIKPIK